jgi:hypothetical protein
LGNKVREKADQMRLEAEDALIDAIGIPTNLRRLGPAGGRWWDRTTDPYDVNVVLSR